VKTPFIKLGEQVQAKLSAKASPARKTLKGKDVGEEKGSGKTNAALQWVAGGKKEGTVFMVALFSRSSSDSSS
jgi:hypothetical protein